MEDRRRPDQCANPRGCGEKKGEGKLAEATGVQSKRSGVPGWAPQLYCSPRCGEPWLPSPPLTQPSAERQTDWCRESKFRLKGVCCHCTTISRDLLFSEISGCVYMCACLYVSLHVCLCIHVYVCVCVVCMHVVCICKCVCMCVRVHAHMYQNLKNAPTWWKINRMA